MNSVIIWNDFVPTNARDIVEYAHERNIKVIWGMPWLWDTNCARLNISDILSKSNGIFEKFEREFGDLAPDGIYFQTFTELSDDNIGGIIVAEAAAEFVNKTASLFYEKYPNIDILFGLHATSIKDRLEFIAKVDQRIRIVWEDCGAFPFSYLPEDISGFESTAEFVKKIALLRGDNDRFGVVTKGFTKLDWHAFKHSEGSHNIGVCSERMKRDRIARKAPIWKVLQARWLVNSDKAYEMVKLMNTIKGGELCVYALVEDSMFEEKIMYPVALYSEMLWNCEEDVKRLTAEVAMRHYVTFA